MPEIGIYRAIDEAGIFYDCPLEDALTSVVKDTISIAPDANLIYPTPGMPAHRIGRIAVEAVNDAHRYIVKHVAPASKPDVNRKPGGAPGTWAFQSIVFDKGSFSATEARQWIQKHPDLGGDYGMEETDNQYRFRQYDPAWFDQMRNKSITAGVSGVYGRIASTRQKDDILQKLVADYESRAHAMQAVNKMIIQTGLLVLEHRLAPIAKDDGGVEEERFVLSLVLEPNNGKDGAPLKPDTQNDVYSAEEIRKGAHNWALQGGQIDLMHNWKPMSREDVCPVENYIAPVSFTCGEGDRAYDVLKGTWMMGLIIHNDELWNAVKRNDIGAYSIGGDSERIPVRPGA